MQIQRCNIFSIDEFMIFIPLQSQSLIWLLFIIILLKIVFSKLDSINFKSLILYKKSYEEVAKVYKNIAKKLEENNLINCASEYYYLSKCIENSNLEVLYLHILQL